MRRCTVERIQAGTTVFVNGNKSLAEIITLRNMEAEVHLLFSSDYYDVCDFKCNCTACTKSKVEYNENFSLTFIRTGNFQYNIFRDALDSFTGSVLISKPGYEYTVTHPNSLPDECTIFTFKRAFYEQMKEQLPLRSSWFFSNNGIQSLLLKINPETEHLHHVLRQTIRQGSCSRLETDDSVMELLQQVLSGLPDYKDAAGIPNRLKKAHLITIEQAKEFISRNFINDISLIELSKHCCVSPFHFSRIFKTFTGYAPGQYLQTIRLKQAELLLKTTLPVADIAFSSGFNSIDYFSAAFRKKYKTSPTGFRTKFQNSARFLK